MISSMHPLFSQSRRIIVKIGSVLVTDETTGSVRNGWLATLAADIRKLQEQGKQVIVVTSGAVALGRKSLGLAMDVPSSTFRLEQKQAAAAIGQIALSHAYQQLFADEGLKVAQLLLSPNDTENRRAHLNARATLVTLVENGIVPVINENDTTATGAQRFGDNDRLAARVAQMIDADLLVILSTTDGLYTGDPRVNPQASHIPFVETITEDVLGVAGEALSGPSTGGMKSKLQAAKIAVDAGTHVIITLGQDCHPLSLLLDGKQKSTVFQSKNRPGTARKRWIGSHLKTSGSISIDDGAAQALLNGKSLLPAGIRHIDGDFERGDAIVILNAAGKQIATGLTSYGSAEGARIIGHNSRDIEDILGYRGRECFIHRDDLVLTS